MKLLSIKKKKEREGGSNAKSAGFGSKQRLGSRRKGLVFFFEFDGDREF